MPERSAAPAEKRPAKLRVAEPAVLPPGERLLPAHQGETCKLCNFGPHLPFSMAFQPIVNVERGTITAYEALARGPQGQAAHTVLNHTLHNNRYAMDQRCREKAIALSASLGLLHTDALLSVNFYPNAVYQPRQCLMRTMQAAEAVSFPLSRIVFEVTEVEQVRSHAHLNEIMTEYRKHGLRIAIDDFGAGHSGLNLLSAFQPDILKLDRVLIEALHERPASRSIVKSVAQVCRELNIEIVAEGIECAGEMQALCDLGIFTMQGFFFARPGFETLPSWSGASTM